MCHEVLAMLHYTDLSGLCPRWFVDIPTANWCKKSAVSCAFVGGPWASDISDFGCVTLVWEDEYLFEVLA